MKTWVEWFSMGGYALYVWPAYGLVCSSLIAIWLVVKKQKQLTKQKLLVWFKR